MCPGTQNHRCGCLYCCVASGRLWSGFVETVDVVFAAVQSGQPDIDLRKIAGGASNQMRFAESKAEVLQPCEDCLKIKGWISINVEILITKVADRLFQSSG